MNTLESGVSVDGKGQALANQAADNLQGGIREAKRGANAVASSASDKVEALRKTAGPALDEVSKQAQGLLERGWDAASSATQKATEFAADTHESVVTYTRARPVTALLIAAATGAVLVSLVRAFTSSKSD